MNLFFQMTIVLGFLSSSLLVSAQNSTKWPAEYDKIVADSVNGVEFC